MAMERWDPLREMMTLREAMDRLFQESVVRPTSSFIAGAAHGAAPIDIAETADGYVVNATVPGLRAEDIQITLKGDTLSIRGERKGEEERKDQNWLIRERRSTSFYRSVTLPTPVNADQAQARYENGVLTLTLPKAEAGVKQIPVRGQAGTAAGQPQMGTTGKTDEAVTSGQQTESQMSASQAAMPPASPNAPGAASVGQEDAVAQASEESFPASDPPAWTREDI